MSSKLLMCDRFRRRERRRFFRDRGGGVRRWARRLRPSGGVPGRNVRRPLRWSCPGWPRWMREFRMSMRSDDGWVPQDDPPTHRLADPQRLRVLAESGLSTNSDPDMEYFAAAGPPAAGCPGGAGLAGGGRPAGLPRDGRAARAVGLEAVHAADPLVLPARGGHRRAAGDHRRARRAAGARQPGDSRPRGGGLRRDAADRRRRAGPGVAVRHRRAAPDLDRRRAGRAAPTWRGRARPRSGCGWPTTWPSGSGPAATRWSAGTGPRSPARSCCCGPRWR